MDAVGAGIGGYSNSSTSNRTQHGVTIKEVKKHERANTRDPKESTALSANERVQNSHKLNSGSGKSSHERANTRESKESTAISASERAQNSHKLEPKSSGKVNERSNQSSSMQTANESRTENSIVNNAGAITATAASSGIIKASTETLKKAGIVASAVIDVDTIVNSDSDFKKEVAVATLATTAVTGPASIGVAGTVSNIVYDSASPDVQKKLDAFAAGPKDTFNQNLNKVEASKATVVKSSTSASETDKPESTRRRRRRKSRRRRPSRSRSRRRSSRRRSSRSSRSKSRVRSSKSRRSYRSRRSRRRRR